MPIFEYSRSPYFPTRFFAWLRIAPQPVFSRLKSVDAINALLMARCSHATPKDACSLSISNADSTLRIFKEQQPFLKGRPERLTTSAQVCSRGTTEEWWRMTGSNRRPPACKAGALPAELIPLLTACYVVAQHLAYLCMRRHFAPRITCQTL